MDFWLLVIVGLPLITIVAGAIANSAKTNSFSELGDIRGRPLNEIVAAVGQPNSISGQAEGTLYQWLGVNGSSSYHYAILVDHHGNAVGYTHQHTS